MSDLRFDMRNGPPDHPQRVMQQLGIRYQKAEAFSIADAWVFYQCEGAPNPLPEFLREIEPVSNG